MNRTISIFFLGLAMLLIVQPGARGDATSQPTPAPATAPASQSGSQQTGGAASIPGDRPAVSNKKPTTAKTSGQSRGDEKKLKPVVVTATRIAEPIAEVGTTVTVVEDQQVEEQKIQDVATVLRQVPGVQVTQTGSPGAEADVSIRGASASQTLILLDGVEVNDGATGSFDISSLTTDNLDRIEVLRGAGGSLYGSQAIGGVVNILSQEGEGAPKLDFLSEGGNRATQRQDLSLNGSDGPLGYSGALSYFSTEGYRPINDSSDNLSGNLRLDYHLDDSTVVRGFARYTRSNVSLVNFSVASGIPLNPTAHQRGEFMLFNGEIEHRFGEHLLARANAFFVRTDLRLNQVPFPGFAGSEVDRVPDEVRGGDTEAVYTWKEGFNTLVGFDFKDRWVRSDSASVFPPFPLSTSLFRARRQEYAGYIEQEARFFDGHLLATGGMRVDGNSQFGEEVSPSWSVAIPVERISTTLRGSYSEGFRAPSFDELYFPDFGNPNQKPEISSEYDGGFTTTFGELASL
ncbi:MAG TPA: TonB-dependent receptor, partial [Candidatus Binataceae bacterium]